MHNLDHFLKHVEDDIAVQGADTSEDAAAGEGWQVAGAKTKKPVKGKKTVAAPVSKDTNEKVHVVEGGTAKKKVGTLNGGVNFVLNDIDNAHSLVSLLCHFHIFMRSGPCVASHVGQYLLHFNHGLHSLIFANIADFSVCHLFLCVRYCRTRSRTSTCSIWASPLPCRRASPRSSIRGACTLLLCASVV